MHHSKLCTLLIDCPPERFERGIEFWSAALGLRPGAPDSDGRYIPLEGAGAPLRLELQRLEQPSALHLDIETDDIEAEVARLEALGATRVRRHPTWQVMEAPTGHRFCVVRPQSRDFPRNANVWNAEEGTR